MDNETHIVIFGAGAEDAERIEQALRKEGLVRITTRVETEAAFVKALEESSPDIVVVDHDLPRFDGMDALKILQAHGPSIPGIMVTGNLDEEAAAHWVQSGAADYVMKERLAGLVPAVKRALGKRSTPGYGEEVPKCSRKEWINTLDSISDWIALVNPEREVLQSNREGETVLGIPIREIIGKNICALVHGEEERIESCPFAEMLKSQKRESAEIFLERKNSRVMVTADPVFDEAGSFMGGVHILQDISDRKKAEEALQLTQFAVDHFSEAAFWCSGDGELFYVNDEACRSLGYSREELLTMTFFDIDPDLSQELWAKLWRDLTRRGSLLIISRHRTKSGGIIPVEISANYLEFEEKGFNCAFVRDITERMQSEEALRESESKFRTIFDFSPQPIALTVLETGKIIDVNEKVCEVSQYSKEELLGRSVMDLGIYSDDERKKLVDTVRTSGAYHGLEVEFAAKDGSIIAALMFSKAIEVAGECFLISIFVDVTDRKRAEEALRERERYFRSLLYTLHEDISVISRDYVITDVNSDILTTTGFKREEVVGKRCFEVSHRYHEPCDKHGEACKLKEVFETGEHRNCRHKHRHRDGSNVWVDILLSPLKDKNGKVTHVVEAIRDVSGIVEANHALRESENKYRSLFENSRDAILMTSRDGKYIDANQAALDLLGYTRDELFATNAKEGYANPRDREILLKTVESRGYVKDYELKLKKKDGTEITCLTTTTVRHDGNGAVIGIQGIMRDVTEQKRAEEAVKRSEERYRSFVQNFRGIAFRGNMDFTPIFFHGAVEAITGYAEREFTSGSKRWDQLIHPEDKDGIFTPDEEKLRSEPDYSYEREYRIIRKDGEICWVFETIQNICDELGKPTMVQGVIYDVTARKRAEVSLRESEQRYRTLTHNIPGMVYRARSDWSTEFISGCEDVCGYPADEFDSQKINWLNLIHPDDKERILNQDAKLLRKPQSLLSEYRIIAKDGTLRWVADRRTPVFSKDGVFQGVDGVVFDISERKRADEALQNTAEIFRSIPSGLYIYQYEEPDRLILLDGNPETENLTAVKVATWRGKEFNEIWPQAKERGITDRLLNVIRTGKTYEAEDVYYKDERFEGVFRVRSFSMSGNRLGVAFENITERKQAEDALRESERKFRSIFDSSPEVIALTEPETGRLINVNDKFCEITEYAKNEVLGKTTVELGFYSENDRARFLNEFRASGKVDGLEMDFKIKDGSVIDGLMFSRLIEISGEKVILNMFVDISERKRAEEMVRRERDKAQGYLDVAGAIIIVIEADRTVSLISKKGCEVLGYEEGEILGKDWFRNFLPETARDKTEAYFRWLIAGEIEPIEDYENSVVTKGGEERIVSWDTVCLRNEDGNVEAILSSGIDVTERVRANEELQKNEARLRFCLEGSGDGTWEWDLGTASMRLSERSKEMLGVEQDRQEFQKSDFVDLTCSDYIEYLDSTMQGVRQGKTDFYEVEFPVKTRDGSLRWIHSRGKVFTRTKGGKPARLFGTMSDITERKQMEEALRESEEKFRSLIDQSVDAIFLADLETKCVIEANPLMARLLGYSNDELTGMSIYEFVAHDRKGIDANIEAIVAKGPLRAERQWRRKDGSLVDTEISVNLISYAGKKVLCNVARDITERKYLEARLQQAQKMEAIGTLAGGIAHDFNNILMGILGYAELMDLFDVSADSPIRSSLKEILKGANRAKDLVQQILTFSRQTYQEKKALQLDSIVKEALRFLRASLPTTIEIRQFITSETAPIIADSTQMHQVIMNLCTNAAHAMREKGGVLRVNLVEVYLREKDIAEWGANLRPGDYLQLTVGDTGCGMDQEVLRRIFDPFFTTKQTGEGTGMGLSVVHGIVTSHGGAIRVESELGKGSTFHVYFPLLKRKLAKPAGEQLTPLPKGKERILLVDDERTVVDVGERILRSLGYAVVGKTSGKEALQVFQLHPDQFDLVVTDLTMPHMTGVDLAKHLLRIRPDIPVILSTGFSEIAASEKAKSIGINGFLQKPFSARHLAESVRRALDRA